MADRLSPLIIVRLTIVGPETWRDPTMPMIDVYAAAGTFDDAHTLAQRLASELMGIEQVPDIPMFRKNTAAFVHDLPPSAISNVDGDSAYVRVQVLTNPARSIVRSSLWSLLDSPNSSPKPRAIRRSPPGRGSF